MLLYIQYAGFCGQQKGRGSKPRHTRRKKGIPTANPSDVSEGAVLLAYIYSIPDFLAGANFYRIFLPAMDGGGMTRDFVLLAEFLPAIFAKKEAVHSLHSQGDAPRKKSLLPQIQFNIKPVKLQATNGKLYIQYIILSPKYNSKAAKAAGSI